MTWDNLNIDEETIKFNKEYNSVKEFIYENTKSVSIGRKNILLLKTRFFYAGLLNDFPLKCKQLLLGHEDIFVTRERYSYFYDKKIKSNAIKVNYIRQKYLSQIVSQRGICAIG